MKRYKHHVIKKKNSKITGAHFTRKNYYYNMLMLFKEVVLYTLNCSDRYYLTVITGLVDGVGYFVASF